MTLKDKLISLKIEQYDPTELLINCVSTRLKISKEIYEDKVEKNCMYILSRNNYKTMKALDRYQRRKEKNNYEEENKYGFIESM